MSNKTGFNVMSIENAGAPFLQHKNDYACFKEIKGKFGVYVFQDKATNQVLYVGQAHKQTLKERITQNYTEKDTGGTFRKNFCDDEGKSFQEFKTLLSNTSIQVLAIDTESKVLISAIESILIAALNPKYNRLQA